MIDTVGEGGMGIVYKAYDPELERAVAIKLLHATGAGGSSGSTPHRDRLLREAKALARLSHPNVLAIFDVGTLGSDVFLATEFVEGPTLAEWLKQGPRPRSEILAVLLEAGEGLAAAHRAGLVHRDFKPSNVIVARDGRVRVLDFGLARADPHEGSTIAPAVMHDKEAPSLQTQPATRVDAYPSADPTLASVRQRSVAVSEAPGPIESRSGTTTPSPGLLDVTITQLGQIVGTPRFMAPEQHLGRPADARCDQFAFCVTLYHALYGEFPFEGRADEYAVQVTQGRVRPAPAGSDVPRWLRAVALRGLSVSPAQRYASMDELLGVLRVDPAAARRRWFAAGAAAVVLLGAGLGLRHARPSAEPPCRGAERKLAGVWDEARKDAMHAAFRAAGGERGDEAFARTAATFDDYAKSWVAMHTDACEATQVRREQSAELLDLRVECLGEALEELRAQVDVFAHADAAAVSKAAQAAHALPRLQTCADVTALRAPVRPPSDEQSRARADTIRASIARAKAEQRAGNYKDALSTAQAATNEAAALGYRPVEAEALFVLGDVQDDRGDYALAEKTLHASFAAALAGRHEPMATRALTALVAEVGLRQARFAEGHDWAKLAEAEAERSTDPFLKGELARNEARVFVREGKYDDARAAIERCLSIWEPALGKDDYVVAGAVTDLGNVLYETGDLVAAQRAYSRSLAITEHTLGPESASLAPNLNNLGELSVTLGDYDAAAQSFERAGALWERALGADHPKVALATYNLSRARRAQGRADEALRLAQRALEIWKAALPAGHPDVAMGMHGVAEAERAKGHYATALVTEERALAMREKIYGADEPDVAESLESIGEIRLAQGGAAAAAAAFGRARTILEKAKATPMDLAEVEFELARAVFGVDPARARNLANAARATFVDQKTKRGDQLVAEVDAWTNGRSR